VIVVDASVLVTALADDGADGRRARARLRGEDLAAPALLDLEFTSALRRLNALGNVPDQRARQALDDLVDLRLERVPHLGLIARCWELRPNLTVYDASYVACAELLEAILLSADSGLARAPGPRCPIELVA
jgi:predicted nucleic acid-binding protein